MCCSASALITFTERVLEKNLAPMRYIIVEVLFGFLLQLPSPPQVPIYYSSVFIELCRMDPAGYPRIVSLQRSVIYYTVLVTRHFLDLHFSLSR